MRCTCRSSPSSEGASSKKRPACHDELLEAGGGRLGVGTGWMFPCSAKVDREDTDSSFGWRAVAI